LNSQQIRRKNKKSARIHCTNRTQFWTSSAQFWQWVREGVVVKIGDRPLTGNFVRADEENLILSGHTVLNGACPEHMISFKRSQRMRIIPIRGKKSIAVIRNNLTKN
jgi:hypothetical protein